MRVSKTLALSAVDSAYITMVLEEHRTLMLNATQLRDKRLEPVWIEHGAAGSVAWSIDARGFVSVEYDAPSEPSVAPPVPDSLGQVTEKSTADAQANAPGEL